MYHSDFVELTFSSEIPFFQSFQLALWNSSVRPCTRWLKKQSMPCWAIVPFSFLWSSCWIFPLVNTTVCAREVEGFGSAPFSITPTPSLFWGGGLLFKKGCNIRVRQAESLWEDIIALFSRGTSQHFALGADCTWVPQLPATEEGTFQRAAQSQTLMQALAITFSSLTAVGIKGNKTDYIIWFVRYLNLDSVNASAVKTKLRGNYSLRMTLEFHTKTLAPPCESPDFVTVKLYSTVFRTECKRC